MPGEHLDAVVQLQQPADGVVELRRALVLLDGQVGAGDVVHEQAVAGQHGAGLAGSGTVDHDHGGVLGTMAGHVQRAQPHLAELDLGAVWERVMRVPGPGQRAHP